MITNILLINRNDITICYESISEFFDNIIEYNNKKKLNNEFFWEFHTRLKKFIIVYLVLTLHLNNIKYESYDSNDIENIISTLYDNKLIIGIDNLWKKIKLLRSVNEVFSQLEKQHLERALCVKNIINIFTYFPQNFTASQCHFILK